MFEKKYYIKQDVKSQSKITIYIKYLFLFFIFLFTINIFANIFLYPTVAKGSIFVSPLAKEIIQRTALLINTYENSSKIENIIMSVLGSDKEYFGVVVRNLRTGERYYFQENKVFDTASLYKLWVMAVVFKQIEAGTLKNDDVISNGITNLNNDFNISSDSAELTSGILVTTVGTALEKMIEISDNYSAMILIEKVTISNVSQFLIDNNFNSSKVGTLTDLPKTTAFDTASFFDKLYHDSLSNIKSSKNMLDLLKKQRLNQKLPKYLPEDVIIAHKTGELYSASHDAGIVYGPKDDYIIVVLSSTKSQSQANEKISQISQKIFDYFEK